MTMALSDADRMRLIKLLGMLNSAFEGERANAGGMADRLIRERGQTWDQVIVKPGAQQQHHYQPPPPRRSWRDVIGDCLKLPELLTPRETEFLQSMTKWRSHPTLKQREWFEKIADRLCVRPADTTR